VPLAINETGISVWADELAEAIATADHFQQLAVLVLDSAANGLRLVSQRWAMGDDHGLLVPGEWLVPLVGSICGRVVRTGVPALASDVSLDPDYLPYTGGRTKSELAVPIVIDGRPIGVVNVEAPYVSAFGIADLEFIRRRIAEAVPSFPVAVGRLDG
jgi:GAF domain-containing protein